jgi:sigma-B regulation protein RsbU (phosphoserine phosphatase)
VILQDLVMPGVDGLDLVSGYRNQEETKLTPLIVLSSKEEGATKAEAFARGANDYIVKLPDPVELIARIRYHSRGYLSLLQRNAAFAALHKSERALAKELAKAAKYVQSLLPKPLTEPVAIDWRFIPSASLGGDCFDYFWIDDDHLVIYLLDVCGHGVGPALLGVSVMSSIRSRAATGIDARDPSAVLRQLNANFQMSQHSGMYFTIWYGVFERSTRELSYTSGGHPQPLLVRGAEMRELEGPSPPIGVVPDDDFPTVRVSVAPNSALLIYSDGAIEVFPEPGKLWGVGGLKRFVTEHGLSDATALDDLLALTRKYSASDVLEDDFSAVLVQFA